MMLEKRVVVVNFYVLRCSIVDASAVRVVDFLPYAHTPYHQDCSHMCDGHHSIYRHITRKSAV